MATYTNPNIKSYYICPISSDYVSTYTNCLHNQVFVNVFTKFFLKRNGSVAKKKIYIYIASNCKQVDLNYNYILCIVSECVCCTVE